MHSPTPTDPEAFARIQERKKLMRKSLQHARLGKEPAARAEANAAIIRNLVALIHEDNYASIAAYCAFEEEPGGPGLVDALLPHVKELWLPLSRPAGQLLWARYTGPEELHAGAYGIPEPNGPAHTSAKLKDLDLIIVPALGSTPAGHRLGKGAGYYDRALEPLDKSGPAQVVVLFDEEIRSDIPYAEHDARIPRILTDKGVRTTSRKKPTGTVAPAKPS